MTEAANFPIQAGASAATKQDPVTTQRHAGRSGRAFGTMLENYDFVVHCTASALVFSKVFFPSISPQAGMIASFSAYTIGFLARPLAACSSRTTARRLAGNGSWSRRSS